MTSDFDLSRSCPWAEISSKVGLMPAPLDRRYVPEFAALSKESGDTAELGQLEFSPDSCQSSKDGPQVDLESTRGQPKVPSARTRYQLVAKLACTEGELAYVALDHVRLKRVLLRVFTLREPSDKDWGCSDRRVATGAALRSALAVAKLSHVELMGLIDVGTWQHGIYVVLSPVSGQSFKEWLKAANSPCHQIVRRLESGVPDSPSAPKTAAISAASIAPRQFQPYSTSTTPAGTRTPAIGTPVWNLRIRPMSAHKRDEQRAFVSSANDASPHPHRSTSAREQAEEFAQIEFHSGHPPERDRMQALHEIYRQELPRTRAWQPGLPTRKTKGS